MLLDDVRGDAVVPEERCRREPDQAAADDQDVAFALARGHRVLLFPRAILWLPAALTSARTGTENMIWINNSVESGWRAGRLHQVHSCRNSKHLTETAIDHALRSWGLRSGLAEPDLAALRMLPFARRVVERLFYGTA